MNTIRPFYKEIVSKNIEEKLYYQKFRDFSLHFVFRPNYFLNLDGLEIVRLNSEDVDVKKTDF